MLKHEQPEEPLSQPAAQVRVTPEELAAAVARLEARRAGADGKIAIGDAVSELSLDATPEEVLAEVRAGQAHFQAVKPKHLSLRERAGLVLAGGAILWALMGYFLSSHPHTSSPAISQVTSISSTANAPRKISLDPNLVVGDAKGKLVQLSEVGDNVPVKCSFSGDTNSFGFSAYSSSDETPWTLIKHNGKVYLRGLVQPTTSKVLSTDGADLICPSPEVTPPPGYHGFITLPVDGFDAVPEGPSELKVVNVHSDQHAYEKW